MPGDRVAGDAFLIHAADTAKGRQGSCQETGTATAPITYRAVGDVIFGLDVRG